MKTGMLLALLVMAASAHANDGTPSASKVDKAADDRKLVCERKKELGSNRMTRVCMTQAEHAAAKQDAQALIQRMGTCSGAEGPCNRGF